MRQDSNGLFWKALHLGGINSFDPTTGTAKRYDIFHEGIVVKLIRTIHCAKDQSILVGGPTGLFLKAPHKIPFLYSTLIMSCRS